jgi:hypothetical protein
MNLDKYRNMLLNPEKNLSCYFINDSLHMLVPHGS